MRTSPFCSSVAVCFDLPLATMSPAGAHVLWHFTVTLVTSTDPTMPLPFATEQLWAGNAGDVSTRTSYVAPLAMAGNANETAACSEAGGFRFCIS